MGINYFSKHIIFYALPILSICLCEIAIKYNIIYVN